MSEPEKLLYDRVDRDVGPAEEKALVVGKAYVFHS